MKNLKWKKIMSSVADEDAVLQELGPYLNIEETDREPIMPSTIQRYHRVVANNNVGSIFDDAYDQENGVESASGHSGRLEKKSSFGLFNDPTVIRVHGGRGGKTPSSRITFVRADTQHRGGLNTDETIHQQLRKVYPTGHSNKIIENSIRQTQKAKSPNHGFPPLKVTQLVKSSSHHLVESSKPSSPATLSEKSSGSSTNLVSRDSLSIFDNESSVESPTSTPSVSDASCSSPSSESRGSSSKENVNTSSTVNPGAATFISRPIKDGENNNKAIPITELLKISREQYKYKKGQQLELCHSDNTEQKRDSASMKKIQEILHQDVEEARHQKIKNSAAQSSNLWPRRTVPRPARTYTNASRNGNQQNVNIKSISDFPPLG